MPTVVTEIPYRPVPMEPPLKRWTRSECAAMEASGAWDQQRLELVEGELISQMGKNRPHAIALTFVRLAIERLFGGQYVDTETSIDVAPEDNPTSEPQPDFLRRRGAGIQRAIPHTGLPTGPGFGPGVWLFLRFRPDALLSGQPHLANAGESGRPHPAVIWVRADHVRPRAGNPSSRSTTYTN